MAHPLECHQLARSFGEQRVLRHVTLSAEPGEIVALLGPSGCGKTTTLRLIAGFDFPDSGTIRIGGRVVASATVRVPPEERQVGMVFQEYALFPHLTVLDNVAFGLNRRDRQRVVELIRLVGLDGLEARMPYELSGGQQQRVALARALAPQPTILLLDEPFSNLDAALRGQVRHEVRAILKTAGITCVFVTHDQEEALSFADRIAVMMQGEVVQIGTPEQIYDTPSTRAVAAFVGEANFVTATAHDYRADWLLGTVELTDAARGQVTLVLRPEMLQVSVPGDDAQVVWREFYGHTQRVGLRLSDATIMVARLDARERLTVGTWAAVQVRQPVRALTG